MREYSVEFLIEYSTDTVSGYYMVAQNERIPGFFLTLGINNHEGIKNLRYAMQRSCNGRQSSSGAKLSCSIIALNLWDLASLSSPD